MLRKKISGALAVAAFAGLMALVGTSPATAKNSGLPGWGDDHTNGNSNGNGRGVGHEEHGNGNGFGHDKDRDHNASPVPEPASMLILGAGALGYGAYRKIKRG